MAQSKGLEHEKEEIAFHLKSSMESQAVGFVS